MKWVTIMMIALVLVSSAVATTVIISSQDKAVGYNNAAYYTYQEGNLEAAETLYVLALDANPDYDTARYNLATLLFEMKRFTDAASELSILLADHPDNLNYKYDLAVNLVEEMRQNDNGWEHFPYALELYREVESAEPGFAHAAENIVVMERILREAQQS